MCCIIYKPKGVQMPSLDILSKIKNSTTTATVLFQPIIFIRVWTIVHSCATSRRSEMTKTALYISDLPLMAQYAGPTVIRLQRMAFISLTMGL